MARALRSGTRILFVTVFLLGTLASGPANGDPQPTGTLGGVVRDRLTGRPIPGAQIECFDRQASTDAQGEFIIDVLQVGVHALRAAAPGYERMVRSGVELSAGRALRIEIELDRVEADVRRLRDIQVQARPVPDAPRAVNSADSLTRVEIQKEVGAAWDIQRSFASQPGVTASSDMTNNLVVRGGNPSENQVFVDHIELPTISHLSWQGETGGAMGLVNLDFVRDATFYTGGFPASFGGKLSSVLDIRFREGNRTRPGGEFEVSMAGVGGGLEGPIGDDLGSWVVSYRKSFLDLLKEPAGLTSIPHFEDAHAKVMLDLSPSHRLSFVGIGGRDDVDIRWVRDVDRAQFDGEKLAVGVNWNATLARSAASRVTVSRTSNFYNARVWVQPREPVYENRSIERETTLEAVLDVGRSYRNAWHLGITTRHVRFRHRIDSEAWRGFSENQGRIVFLGAQNVDARHSAAKFAAFLHRDLTFGDQLSVKAGVRYRHFTLTDASNVGPRVGLEWRPDSETTFSVASGIYHQSPTYVELTLDERNLTLDDTRARHVIVGVERRLGAASRLLVEAYAKDYEDVAVFSETESVAPSGFLVNAGKKRVRGIDFLLEKRLRDGVFGSVLLTLSDAKAKSATGDWYPADFDAGPVFSISGGMPTIGKWRFSGKWRFVGGRPWTNFPTQQGPDGKWELVPDFRERNQMRYPDYHRLDLRLDRRIDFTGWGGFLFFEIQNVYDRANVFSRQFNVNTGESRDVRQFKRLGVLGLIVDF